MKLLIKSLALTALLVAVNSPVTHAAAPVGKQVTAAIRLQGGSDSSAQWVAPSTAFYKVHVFTPKNAATTNALYRVYPKGKKAGSNDCLSTDVSYPCYEVTVDQTQHQNAWTQLLLNNDPTTQWSFVKNKGYVTAVASNLSAAELLNLSALVRFEHQTIAIGKTYQGGIIFYIDSTGEHGLVAAPTDQSTGIQWYNGSFINTDAIGTAVGTGLDNTNTIIAAQGTGSYAAQLCADLVLGGYSDWFLPSRDELALMYTNIGPKAADPLTNIGNFAYKLYWSSSDNYGDPDYITAFVQDFSGYLSNISLADSKHRGNYVRAVRAF